MALQKCLVGEQFTGYLHVTNTSGHVVDNVGLRVEIDIGTSKYTLLNTASASKNLPAGDSVDALVEHPLSTAGTYALTCIVFYSCNGEQGQFRRAYRFPALAPFAVSQRVVQMDRQLLVECLVENSTEGSIFLSSWGLDCAEGLQSELLTEMDPIIGSSGPLLKQRGCFSLVFRVTPQDESVDSAALREREAVGVLSLCWQVPDGPRGCMEGHQIQVKAMAVFDLDLQVVQCPAQVKVEEPFSLELQVTNRTGELLQPKVGFDLRMMGAVKLQGPCQRPLQLQPGQRKRLPIELVITVPGLHTLQGVSIACDKVGPERLDFGVLCDLLAF
ncbi:unnamed protein product [Cladocopium goreaui]|uniref:Trafficking protein particle complex subunit 13 homolog n=1 Tax=Cladocopium goreaui TaxID=2562237 RepID=A0A9P1BGF4_9DINO|nr:unnamed protein product [Cladocopium goreaui]